MCNATPAAELHVPATAQGSWVARQFVANELCRRHAGSAEVEACLVASAMVSDALRNGGSPVTLSLECWGSSVVVKVTDNVTRAAANDDPRHRLGTLLMDRCSVDRGIEPRSRGRTLWCLLPTRESPARDEPSSVLAEVQ